MSARTARSTYRGDFTSRSHASIATSRLSTSRRNRLEQLRDSASGDRERKRLKLEAVLKNKLVNKYGTAYSAMITAEVSKFIKATMSRKIHENDLSALENAVRRRCQRGETNRSGTARTGRSTRRGSARGDGLVPETGTARSNARAGTARDKGQAKLDEWTLLDAFDALNNEQHTKAKKQREREVQLSLKRELDQQVALRKSLEAKEKAEEVEYYKNVYKEVEEFHKQEKEKAKVRQRKVMAMAAERKKQVELERKRREKAKEDQMKYELNLLKTAAREIKKDQYKHRRARAMQVQHMRKVRVQNEELQRQKEIQRREEAAEDRRLMEEFAAREEKKMADRAAFFEATALKQQKRAAANKKNRSDEFAKIREAEQRLIREQLEREKRAAEEEKRQERMRRNRLAERNRVLKMQVDAKRKARELQRRNDAEYVKTFQVEAQRFQSEQEAQRRRAKQKKLSYRQQLAEQMAQERVTVANMTDHERLLNKEKLSKITGDPKMMKTLYDRVMKGTFKRKTNRQDDDAEIEALLDKEEELNM